jgi:hypothetical protein
MPPLTRNNGQRELEVMIANPAKRAHAVATGQQGGYSGQIPGTGSDPQQLAASFGTIQQYPAATTLSSSASVGDTTISVAGSIASGSFVVIDINTATSTQETNLTTGVSGSGPYTVSLSQPLAYAHANGAPVQAPTPSPNGDMVAGVGHAVLNNAGNPVVIQGNLSATQTDGTDLPADFQDGGFAFVDADGNLVAGYSQETGLWGFGGGGGGVGFVTTTLEGYVPFDGLQDWAAPPAWITVPITTDTLITLGQSASIPFAAVPSGGEYGFTLSALQATTAISVAVGFAVFSADYSEYLYATTEGFTITLVADTPYYVQPSDLIGGTSVGSDLSLVATGDPERAAIISTLGGSYGVALTILVESA